MDDWHNPLSLVCLRHGTRTVTLWCSSDLRGTPASPASADLVTVCGAGWTKGGRCVTRPRRAKRGRSHPAPVSREAPVVSRNVHQ